MPLKVVISDDHQIVRQGLRALLEKEADIEVVGEAEDGRATMRMASELLPDVIIMDISMPDLNGIEATRAITARRPKIKVIALSIYSNKRFIANMLKAGASGYLLKNCAFNELVDAIRAVSMNNTYLSPSICGVVVKDYVDSQAGDSSAFSVLTAREREVLQLIAEGKTTRTIASSLNLSIKTIETYRQQIMDKVNAHTMAGMPGVFLSNTEQ